MKAALHSAHGHNHPVPLIAAALAATAVARPALASDNASLRHRAQAEPTGLDNDDKRAQVTENNTGTQDHSAGILADPNWIPNGDGISGDEVIIKAPGSGTQHHYLC